jgi:hypothetical protein
MSDGLDRLLALLGGVIGGALVTAAVRIIEHRAIKAVIR